MRRINWAILSLVAGMLALQGGSGDPPPAGMTTPSYTEDGSLRRPRGYETWVHIGSSLGLSYAENARRDPPGLFHNVYIQPEAFAHYRRTGRFPEKTMLALTLHDPRQKESIAKDGYFQGDLVALEFALKDSERHAESWAYYDFGGGDDLKAVSTPFPKDRCFACHRENGADDNVFVQFYPLLRDVRTRRTESSR